MKRPTLSRRSHIGVGEEIVDLDWPAHLSGGAVLVGAEHGRRTGATLFLDRLQIALGRRVEHEDLFGSL